VENVSSILKKKKNYSQQNKSLNSNVQAFDIQTAPSFFGKHLKQKKKPQSITE
jgi:hypothetical protein